MSVSSRCFRSRVVHLMALAVAGLGGLGSQACGPSEEPASGEPTGRHSAASVKAEEGAGQPPVHGSHARYPVLAASLLWTEQQEVLASDGASGDRFGRAVALSGDTAIVSANFDDDAGDGSGSAYIFVRTATRWSEQQKLTASDGASGDLFGTSVALDGDTALVGAYRDDDGGVDSGSAYVFVRAANGWSEQQKVSADDGAAGADFGGTLVLNGETALIGAKFDDAKATDSGSAYVFVRTASNWSQQQKLTASDGAATDLFGVSVALSGDTALIGASLDDDAGSNAGSAYVFVRAAKSWSALQELTAADAAIGDGLGGAVALEGQTALIGARHTDREGDSSGSVYVFVRNAGSFAEQQVLVASDGAAGDGFGGAVALGGDTGLIGGVGHDHPESASGSAYVVALLLAGGESCNGDGVCASKFCVDGVCCEDACDGGCGSCSVAGREGICSPLSTGDPGAPSCAPYMCTGGDAACPSSCGASSDCTSGNQCAGGLCKPEGVLGTACTEDVACAAGHCTDGVCCAADSCGAYRCGPAGACEPACSSNGQCATGHECTSIGKCEPLPGSSDAAEQSGACRLAGPPAPAPTSLGWLGGIGVLIGLRNARRRRRAVG